MCKATIKTFHKYSTNKWNIACLKQLTSLSPEMKLVSERRRCYFSPSLSSNRKLFLRGVLKICFVSRWRIFASRICGFLCRVRQISAVPSLSVCVTPAKTYFFQLFLLAGFSGFFCQRDLQWILSLLPPIETVILHFIMNNKINDKNNISSQIGRKFFKSVESLKSFQSFTRNQPWKVLMLDSLFGNIVSF